jgi:hypothetical protein
LVVYVNEHTVPVLHAAGSIAQRLATHIEPSVDTVCALKATVGVVRGQRFQVAEPGLHFKRDVVWMYFRHPPPTNDLLKRRPKVFEQAFVDVIDVAVGPRPPH